MSRPSRAESLGKVLTLKEEEENEKERDKEGGGRREEEGQGEGKREDGRQGVRGGGADMEENNVEE